MDLEVTESLGDSKRASPDPRSQTVHLYPTGGDGCEYTTELLSQLTSSVFPAITSSQVSSVLSSLDAQHLHIIGDRLIEGDDPLKLHSTARMEKQENDKKCWYKCRDCEQVCLDEMQAASHSDRCQGPVKKVKCIACHNTFKSTAVLKAHLLIDHSVSIGEHPDVIAINMALYNPFSSHKSDGEGKERTEPGTEQFQERNGKKKESEDKKGVKSEKEVKRKDKKQEAEGIKGERESGMRCGLDGCAVRLLSLANLNYHRQCHNGGNWRCCECGETMGSWPSLTLHLWRQHAVDMELYSCDHCSYKTNSLSNLVNLHRRTHSEDRPFLCDLCGKGFKNTKQLRNHKTVHRSKDSKEKTEQRRSKEVREESLECEICSRRFSCARMLRHHRDIVHRKLRPYLCSDCGHAAASKSSLRMHARLHTGEKPYACSECDYKTSDHNTLRRHKMRHSGTKRYVCPHCPYASIQSSTFKSHLNNKHPGLDNGLMFSCEVCPFKTVKKENFLAHTSYHSLKDHDLAKEPEDVHLHEYSLR